MASTPLYPDAQGAVDALLRTGSRVKDYAVKVTEKYAAGPESPLDGKIHLSLQPPTQLVAVISSETPAVVNRPKLSAETKESNATTAEQSTTEKEEQFKQTMREYEKTAKQKYRTGINPDNKHTTSEVEAIVKEAINKYQTEDTRGVWGKVRLACRKLGDGSEAIQGWLGLLPTQSEYLSVVCGGLKLILTAASRMKNVADKVMEALQQIPTLISSAQRVLQIYKDSDQLKILSTSFYGSILAALGHILEYLRQKSLWKALKAGFQQASFEKLLLEKVDNVTKDRNAFNDEANICQKEMIERLESVQKENSDEARKRTQGLLETVKFACQEQTRANREMRETLELMQMTTMEIKRRQIELDQKFETKIDALKEAVMKPYDLMMQMLEGNPNLTEFASSMVKRLDAPEPSQELESPKRRASMSTIAKGNKSELSPRQQRTKFLSRLDYDADAAGADLMANYTLGPNLSLDDQNRGIYVIKAKALAAWVNAERSAALVINGNAGSIKRRSSMSFVCARLVYALEQIRSPPGGSSRAGTPDVVVLYFFCGQHASGDYSWETPSGIVNSFLAQLLTQCKHLDLTKVTGRGSFDSGDMKAVLKRLYYVLGQLPAETTVFCVIDGLSYYVDNDKTSDDADKLIKKLLKLARGKSRNRYAFKLLLTVPNRLHGSEVESLGDDEVLDIPSNPPKAGGFTAMKWNLSAGCELERFANSVK